MVLELNMAATQKERRVRVLIDGRYVYGYIRLNHEDEPDDLRLTDIECTDDDLPTIELEPLLN